MTNDQQRFEQLLPFYVNGTLTEQEREFVSAYLAKHNHARQSLTWTSSIQRTIQDLGSVAPDDQRVNRFLQKLAEQQQPKHTQQKNQSSVPSFLGLAGARENGSRRDWWLVIMGFGFAGLATLLVLMPGLFQNSVLHWDQLDGRADIRVTLAENVKPSDPVVIASLQRYNAMVLEQKEVDGRYELLVDLKRRSHDQHPLIQAMRDDGHLESYTLLAAR